MIRLTSLALLLCLFSLPAFAQNQPLPASRDTFRAALTEILKANPTVKAADGCELSKPAITSLEVRENAQTPGDILGLGRVAYCAPDATPRDFELILRHDQRWIFLGAFSVTHGPNLDTISEVSTFMTPPSLQAVVLPGEEDKPVQTTESGLKYVVLEEGQGDKPKKGATITAEYTGWLTDGTKFDSSKDHPGEFSFAVGTGQVIAGWDEALLDMKPGESRKLILPPNLGYGARGAGGVIPPNATLIFEVKLVNIK